MRLYLARHAQTPSNVTRALDTAHPGAPLTELGHQQVARLVARMAGTPLTALAASSLTRAQQTAAPFSTERGLPVLTLDGLREVDAGDYEMQTSGEAEQGYISVLHAWADGDLSATMPGGTDGHEFTRRYDDAMRELEGAAGTDPGASVLAVSHGAAIRTWAAIGCVNADAAVVSRHRLANTAVIVLDGSVTGGWRLEGWIEDHIDGPAPDDALKPAVLSLRPIVLNRPQDPFCPLDCPGTAHGDYVPLASRDPMSYHGGRYDAGQHARGRCRRHHCRIRRDPAVH